MRNTKHTPGPWRMGPRHKDGSFAIHAERASVFHVTPFASSEAQAEANVRLAIAAPDLLTAAEQTLKLWRKHGLGDEDAESEPVYNLLRAAIEKARGEQK